MGKKEERRAGGPKKGSMRKGGGKSKKPVHQNKFGFRHNLNSKLTKRITGLPNVGLCGRCTAVLEWRKKYRRYKPRKNPSKCVSCGAKKVRAAYHTLCPACASAGNCCAKCHFSKDDPSYQRRPDIESEGGPADDDEDEGAAAAVSGTAAVVLQIQAAEIERLRAMPPHRLKERDRRKLARAADKGL